jgi:putative addiction module component (TIGR02574 family)
MNKPLTPDEICQMTVAERLELIGQVWDTLVETPEAVEVPQWHKDVLEERLAALDRDPSQLVPFDEAMAGIRQQLRK